MYTYLVIGKKFSNLIAHILDNGDEYILLADRAAVKHPEKSIKRRVVTDFSSRESLLKTVDELRHSFDGVVATYENYILPAAWVADHLNLPGLPLSAAEACTDKELMRSLFAAAPEQISPAFAVVKNEQDIRNFAESHQFPIILKPANLAKSLLVTKNDNMDELVTNYQKSTELLSTTYKKYAPNRVPKMIIEEFLEGSIHSVDAFVDADGNPQVLAQIVDYQTGYDIGYDDNFHYSRILPSILSAEMQASLRHCAELGTRALGIKSAPAHIEIIMTRNGPRIVEIGARNGGYRERMHGIANGIDINGAALALARGEKPHISVTREDSCAVLELFPKTPGIFERLENEQLLRQLPSLKYLNIKATVGSYVGKSSDGYKMCAIIILHNTDAAQFQKDLIFVNDAVQIVTKTES